MLPLPGQSPQLPWLTSGPPPTLISSPALTLPAPAPSAPSSCPCGVVGCSLSRRAGRWGAGRVGRRAKAIADTLFPTDPPPDPGSRLELRPGVAGAPSASTPPHTQRLPPTRPSACAGERACTHAHCTKTSTPLQPGKRTPFGSAHSGEHAPAPSRSHTRTYTHPACALTYTHSHTHTHAGQHPCGP